MKIKFLGAVGEVTGSCTWCILDSGVQFLVDCGMFQGGGSGYANHKPFPFNPRDIAFVLLTHAHIDHCGRIPLLYKQGFEGEIVCTKATQDLAMLNLQDSAKQQFPDDQMSQVAHQVAQLFKYNKEEISSDMKEMQKNIKKKLHFMKREIATMLSALAAPLYDESDIKKIRFSNVIDEHVHGFNPKSTSLPVGHDVWVNFTRSSHMLGASSITVTWGKNENARKIFFSGDVGNNRHGCSYQPLLRRNQIALEVTDYVVLESTYGEKPPKEDKYKDARLRIEELKKIVLNPDYKAIIFPCFAIQRTQDVLMDLVCTLAYCGADSARYRIVLDSAMGIKACKIFREHLTKIRKTGAPGENVYLTQKYAESIRENYGAEFDLQDLVDKVFSGGQVANNVSIEFCKRLDIREEIKKPEKIILITSSGMCQEGNIRFHIMSLLHPSVAMVLTGYQSTHNGRLLQWCATNHGEVAQSTDHLETCLDATLPVRNIQGTVFNMGAYYSGHADSDNLMRFLFDSAGQDRESESPRKIKVFLNHGDIAARRQLGKTIRERAPKASDMRIVEEVIIPEPDGKFYDLNKNVWSKEPYEIVIENQQQIMEKLDKLIAAMKRDD